MLKCQLNVQSYQPAAPADLQCLQIHSNAVMSWVNSLWMQQGQHSCMTHSALVANCRHALCLYGSYQSMQLSLSSDSFAVAYIQLMLFKSCHVRLLWLHKQLLHVNPVCACLPSFSYAEVIGAEASCDTLVLLPYSRHVSVCSQAGCAVSLHLPSHQRYICPSINIACPYGMQQELDSP